MSVVIVKTGVSVKMMRIELSILSRWLKNSQVLIFEITTCIMIIFYFNFYCNLYLILNTDVSYHNKCKTHPPSPIHTQNNTIKPDNYSMFSVLPY